MLSCVILKKGGVFGLLFLLLWWLSHGYHFLGYLMVTALTVILWLVTALRDSVASTRIDELQNHYYPGYKNKG